MKLSTEDANLFFKLYWGLLWFANEKYPVIHGLAKPHYFCRCLVSFQTILPLYILLITFNF